MANRLYNKQVSPKGYQKGGSVKKDYKLGTKFQGDYKGKSVPGKVKEFFKTGVKQTVGTAKKILSGNKRGKDRAKASIQDFARVKKMGGGMMKRPMMKKGGIATEAKKKQFKANQAKQKETTKKVLTDNLAGDIYKDKRVRKFASKVKEGLKNSPLNLKGAIEGYTGLAKKIKERMGKKMGGSLKPVDPKTQKGLSKLPTEVRNKMGYMKKGGKVHGKQII